MDTGLVYGVFTAATAVASGASGARAAYLSREAGPSGRTPQRLARTTVDAGISKVQDGVREAIGERCAGAQNAAAWFATSTALLGVASTRSAEDAIGIAFVVIAIALAGIAIRAMLVANSVANLPPARAAFEKWYTTWIRDRISAGERPSDEETAEAFLKESPRFGPTMRKFGVWPFHIVLARRTIPPSEWSWWNKPD